MIQGSCLKAFEEEDGWRLARPSPLDLQTRSPASPRQPHSQGPTPWARAPRGPSF